MKTSTADPVRDPQVAETPRRGGLMLAGSIAVLVVATSLVIIGTAPPTTVAVVPLQRVTYSATPKPTPQPMAVADGCPHLTNPGGRLDWTPSADAGPAPTNGKIALPSIAAEAPIVRVGIDTEGLMVVPTNARDVGWLDQGGIPGRTNNLVVAGHIDYNRVSGTFSRLADLKPGHEVSLTVDDKELKYRVVWNCSFDRDTELADQIMGYTTVPSMTLISCGGVFDTAARTHTDRIVVRAELVTEA